MGLLVLSGFFVAVTFALLHDGVEGKPTWYLAMAWATGALALHALATFVILTVRGNADELLGHPFLSLIDPTVAIATVAASVVLALLLRRRSVVFIALASSPFLAWFWSPVFLSTATFVTQGDLLWPLLGLAIGMGVH